MYAKSVADLLIKFLNVDESIFKEEMDPLPQVKVITAEEVVQTKQDLLSSIVEKLSSKSTEEDNWNATALLTDLTESDVFAKQLETQDFLNKILDMAITGVALMN